MSGLAIPRKLAVNAKNVHICRRLGVRFNGVDQGTEVLAYDLDAQTITRKDEGEQQTLHGKVEVYWR